MRIVGVGSSSGDDAVGLLAVRAARAELERLGVEVHEVGAGVHLLDLLQDADAVVVVDAVRAEGLEPGEIVRLEAGPEGLPAEIRSSLSSHGLGVAEAVALATAMPNPPRVVFVGVVVVDTRAGDSPNARALRSVAAVQARVVAEARTLSRG